MHTGIVLTLDPSTNEPQYEVFVEGKLIDIVNSRAKAEELLLLGKAAVSAGS